MFNFYSRTMFNNNYESILYVLKCIKNNIKIVNKSLSKKEKIVNKWTAEREGVRI